MLENLDMDFLTIREAAGLLRVSTVTLHRWIKQRRLPAYHAGPRKVRIRRSDLMQVLAPVHGEEGKAIGEPAPTAAALDIKPLTEQEVIRALEALREADELIQAIRTRRKGKPLSPSWPLIRKAREDRSKRLL